MCIASRRPHTVTRTASRIFRAAKPSIIKKYSQPSTMKPAPQKTSTMLESLRIKLSTHRAVINPQMTSAPVPNTSSNIEAPAILLNGLV
jgi:hypothetical protein